MARSICIVSREYPPETSFGGIASMTRICAIALAAEGIAVHVVSLSTSGLMSRKLDEGVVVHRIPCPATPALGCPDIDQSLWAAYASDAYRRLDSEVKFDVVIGPDYFADTVRIETAPSTLLVVQLHTCRAVLSPELLDERFSPADRAAAELELMGIRRADVVIAPTSLIQRETNRHVEREIVVLPPPFDSGAFVGDTPKGPHELELVFVGRLEPNKQPELAIAATMELRSRGVDAHLTLVGRDTPLGHDGESYRRSVLLPLLFDLDGDFECVRFVEQLDREGVAMHLRVAHAAVLPSRFENLQTVAIEALAAGIPVVAGDRTGLSGWISPEQGLATISTGDMRAFSEAAADQLMSTNWLQHSGKIGHDAVLATFDPKTTVESYLQFFAKAAPPACIPSLARQATQVWPKLGIIMLAHNALPYTKRALASILEHTDVPFELIVVDNASTDGTTEWLQTISDRRIRPLFCQENRGVSGGRNIGLEHLVGNEDFVVFLDNDVEVLARWWEPALSIFESDPTVGIVGEDGVLAAWTEQGREIVGLPDPGGRCTIAVGYCMFMRPQTIARIGRFDESLGLFWHDDDEYAMRAERIGENIAAARSGRVVHFEHKSSANVPGVWESASDSKPAAMSEQNQRYLAERRLHQRITATSPFLVLADVEEVLEHPEILSTYGATFTREDNAALVVHGVCNEAGRASYLERLESRAAEVGFSLDDGPSLILLLPQIVSGNELRILADEVYGVMSTTPPAGAFRHLAWLPPSDSGGLRMLAARAWAARPLDTSSEEALV